MASNSSWPAVSQSISLTSSSFTLKHSRRKWKASPLPAQRRACCTHSCSARRGHCVIWRTVTPLYQRKGKGGAQDNVLCPVESWYSFCSVTPHSTKPQAQIWDINEIVRKIKPKSQLDKWKVFYYIVCVTNSVLPTIKMYLCKSIKMTWHCSIPLPKTR